MRIWSAWKLWNTLAGRPAAEKNIQAVTSDGQLTRALHGLRDEQVRMPSWNSIERLILTGKREQSMAISRTAVFAFSRQAAVIAAASVLVVLAFFTVPFSQTGELGSNIIFEFDPPLADPQGCCERFGNTWTIIGNTENDLKTCCSMGVKVSEDGLESFEIMLLAESGLTPDEVIANFKILYPELEQARVTINPITEHTTSTMFGKLVGNRSIKLECEGKTAEEIKAEVESILASQGYDNPEVKVVKTDANGQTVIKICAPAGACGK